MDSFYADIEEMDALGDDLMAAGKMNEAVKVLKLNTGEHPDVWWVHQKLAQAYVLLGDAKSAAVSYRKASELNPKNYPWEKKAVYTLQLEQALFTQDVNAAKEKFLELKNKYPDFVQIAEGVMNDFGYKLLQVKRIDDAISVFKINVETFPDSWNAYDSLAEAYMEDGNRELAIQNYEKSLELNPDNTNALNKLKQLKNK